jgi:hypothetical protein
MDLNDFVERAVKRCVRDGHIIITSDSNEFFVQYDWPVIEQVKAMVSDKDKRFVLLARDIFDYIDLRKFSGISYGSDVSKLEIPFDPEERQFLVYSEQKNGQKIFTVNLGYELSGKVNIISADGNDMPDVSMHHKNKELPELIEAHLARLNNSELLTDTKLYQRAIKEFDRIMNRCRHLN